MSVNKINFRVSKLESLWIKDLKYVDDYLLSFEKIDKNIISKRSAIIYDHYYNVCKKLSVFLNTNHGVNFSEKFWRKTFNYGLLILITDLYQHFKYLESHYNPQKNISNILSLNSFKILDTFEQQRKYLQSDLGYEQIFSLYIRFKKYDYQREIILQEKSDLKILNNLKSFIRNFVLKFSSKKKIKTLILNSYFERKHLLEIQNKNTDYIFFNRIFLSKHINFNLRNKISILDKKSADFELFLNFCLKYLLPKIYLEGFRKSMNLTIRILKNYPKLRTIISEGWITDTPSSFILAIAKNEGIKHYCNEHNSYTHPFLGDFLRLSIELSDKFLTLGWINKSPKVIKSSSLFRFRTNQKRKKDNILFVAGPLGLNYPIYSTCYGSCGYFSNSIIDFNNNFFSKISENILSSIIFRNYPNYKSEQIKLRNSIYNDLVEKHNLMIDNLETDCLTQMSKSKLIIIDYISTSFIEALASNIPVIIFLTPGYILDDKYSDFFDPLIDSGIFQTNPYNAAKLVNSIIDYPRVWWESEKVQTGRRQFLSKNFGEPNSLKKLILKLNSL